MHTQPLELGANRFGGGINGRDLWAVVRLKTYRLSKHAGHNKVGRRQRIAHEVGDRESRRSAGEGRRSL